MVMILKKYAIILVVISISIMSFSAFSATRVSGLDENNCLTCHGNENLEIVNGDGEIISLYVNEIAVNTASHRFIDCTTCHTIDPHNIPTPLTKLSLAEPKKFDDIAWGYPNLKLVFEHLGGRTYFEEFMAIISNHKRGKVFGGLTSVFTCKTHKLWYLGPEKVTDLIRCVGAAKLIYGLDFPYNSPETNKRDIEIIGKL